MGNQVSYSGREDTRYDFDYERYHLICLFFLNYGQSFDSGHDETKKRVHCGNGSALEKLASQVFVVHWCIWQGKAV